MNVKRTDPGVRLVDREGRDLSEPQWAALLADDSYHRVRRDFFGTRQVVTVWIGFFASHIEPSPRLFLTTVHSHENGKDVEVESAWGDDEKHALKSHREMVKKWIEPLRAK